MEVLWMIRGSVTTMRSFRQNSFVQLDHMTNEERKIYDMVVRRFLAVLYPASQYEQVTMEAKAAGENFCSQRQK